VIVYIISVKIATNGAQTSVAVDATKLQLSFGNMVASFEGIGTILPVEGRLLKK